MNQLTLSVASIKLGSNRKFKGIAYSGDVLMYYGQHIVIDLDTAKLDAKQIPLLHNHDSDRHVAFGYLSREESNLIVSGEMLTNEHAQSIIDSNDEGLSWQMSVGVESDRLITRHKGDVVNGKALEHDDVLVFSDAVIREVSFTPVGVDANTEVALLSLSGDKKMNELEKAKLELSQKATQAAELSAVITAKDAEIVKLKAEIADKDNAMAENTKQAKLSRLKEVGIEGEEADTFAELSDSQFDAMLSRLKLSAKQTALLGENYTHEDDGSQRENPLKAALKLNKEK